MWVPGVPVPQGSMRSRGNRPMGHDNADKLKPWRAVVAFHANEGWRDGPTDAAVLVECTFAFRRPRGHYGTGRNAGQLKASAPVYKTSAPDLDKLVRAVLDALTGVVFVDDKQVVDLGRTQKRFATDPGVQIIVRELS